MFKKTSFYVSTLILGVILIGFSFLFQGEEIKAVSGIFIGIGSGLLGMSVANLLMKRYVFNDPKRIKQTEIEYKDERNTVIRYKARMQAGILTRWLVLGLAFLTILTRIQLWLTLSLVGRYFSVVFYIRAILFQ